MSNTVLDWEKPETWTGMLDRSPCGTGTCAVMALMHSRGELGLNEDFIHESIIGT
jgi:proline racemase